MNRPERPKTCVTELRMDIRILAALFNSYKAHADRPQVFRSRSEFVKTCLTDYYQLLLTHGKSEPIMSTEVAREIIAEISGYYPRDTKVLKNLTEQIDLEAQPIFKAAVEKQSIDRKREALEALNKLRSMGDPNE